MLPVQIEREDGRLDESLFDHAVENGGDSVDGDWAVGHAEDAVEFGSDKCKSGFAGCFSKHLLLHVQTSNL